MHGLFCSISSLAICQPATATEGILGREVESHMWKIAIIDDDRQVLQGMKRAIPWEELNAEWAGDALNGADGLELIRRVEPDVVITDIYMPVMNGLDMIEQLREEEYGGKIIILSGYSDFEYARQALRLHVSDYMSKPISLPTLNSVLGKALQELAEEEEARNRHNELADKLKRYEPFVEKEWVSSAVTGTLDRSYKSGDLPEPYQYWTEQEHLVIGIELVRDVRASELSLPDWNLFRFALRNIVCEVAQGTGLKYEYAEMHGTRSVLLLHPERGSDPAMLAQRMDRLGTELIDCMQSYLKLVIRVGIGSLKQEWQQIPDSTEEAFHAIESREIGGENGYYLYRYAALTDEGQGSGGPPLRPVKLYAELAGAIKTSQEAMAHQIVSGYMEQLEGQDGISPEYLQMLAGELWGIFAYCLHEVGMVLDDIFPNHQIAKELAGISRIDQLREWLKDKITVICSSRQWRGNSKHRQAVDFMIQYIHEHYTEDITLSELADKVYISRNYLAIIFKNMTGETFNTYLTRVRIERAKELIMEKNMLVYEVAEQVGYRNVPYFSTLFKKYTGMNPTELVK